MGVPGPHFSEHPPPGSPVRYANFAIPWLVLKALRDFEFAGVDDFGPQALGMQYGDGANPEGLRFTGDARPRVTDQDHDW